MIIIHKIIAARIFRRRNTSRCWPTKTKSETGAPIWCTSWFFLWRRQSRCWSTRILIVKWLDWNLNRNVYTFHDTGEGRATNAMANSPEFPLLSPIQHALSIFKVFPLVEFKSCLLLSLVPSFKFRFCAGNFFLKPNDIAVPLVSTDRERFLLSVWPCNQNKYKHEHTIQRLGNRRKKQFWMRSTGITFRYSHELIFSLKSNAREKNQYFAHIKASCFKPKKYV